MRDSDDKTDIIELDGIFRPLADLPAEIVDERGEVLGYIVVSVLDRQQEMSAEAIVLVNLGDAAESWTKIPVPVCKVGIGALLEIGATLPDWELLFIYLWEERINEGNLEMR